MIHIEYGQKVESNQDHIVVVPTGDYDEIDLLECAHKDNPDASICMYQAQYIKFGGLVYQQDDILTEKQASELIAGVSSERVINNKNLIEGFRKAGPRAGRIIGRRGVIKEKDIPDEPVNPIIKTPTDQITPIVPVTSTTTSTTITPTTPVTSSDIPVDPVIPSSAAPEVDPDIDIKKNKTTKKILPSSNIEGNALKSVDQIVE